MTTRDEIEAAKTPRGGYTRAQLAQWGIPWPPPRGWKRRLLKSRKGTPELAHLGFKADEFGQQVATGCRVTLCRVGTDYTMAITLPSGTVLGFNTQISVHARSTAQLTSVGLGNDRLFNGAEQQPF